MTRDADDPGAPLGEYRKLAWERDLDVTGHELNATHHEILNVDGTAIVQSHRASILEEGNNIMPLSTIRGVVLAVAIGGLSASPVLAGSSDGLTSVTGPTVFYGEDFSLGWEFATTGETITALGYNNFGFGTPHDVGVYDSVGDLLASASVTAASALEGGYRYAAISPLTLAAGDYFLMGTTYSAGDTDGWTYQAASFATNAATTYIESYFNSDSSATTLLFPDSAAPGRQYLEVNFQTGGSTVPEPAAWALMLVGFGGLGAAMRGSRRQRATA